MKKKAQLIGRCSEEIKKARKNSEEKVLKWKNYMQEAGKICIFGGGVMGERSGFYLQELGIEVECYIDNYVYRVKDSIDIQNKKISIYPVEKLKDFSKNGVLLFLAAGEQHITEILKQLEEYNFCNIVTNQYMDYYLESLWLLSNRYDCLEEKVVDCIDLYNDEKSLEVFESKLDRLFCPDHTNNTYKSLCESNQYFLENGNRLKNNEVIVDCGAYTGDTLCSLIEEINYTNFREYHAYEIDKRNFDDMENYVKKLQLEIYKKIFLHNVGVGKAEIEIKYDEKGIASTVTSKGDSIGKIVKLDDEFKKKKITFLKMDIEGSEQGAILGGANVLKRDKPQCAISVYHFQRDLWEIPLMLHALIPEYSFVLRHHKLSWDDTVCYAIV